VDECKCGKELWNTDQPKNAEEKSLRGASSLTVAWYSVNNWKPLTCSEYFDRELRKCEQQ